MTAPFIAPHHVLEQDRSALNLWNLIYGALCWLVIGGCYWLIVSGAL